MKGGSKTDKSCYPNEKKSPRAALKDEKNLFSGFLSPRHPHRFSVKSNESRLGAGEIC